MAWKKLTNRLETLPKDSIGQTLRRERANPFRVGMVIGGVITVAVVLLIVQNGESARLDWLAFHFETPLWIMLLLTLVAGGIVWELTKALWRHGQRVRRARLQALKAAETALK